MLQRVATVVFVSLQHVSCPSGEVDFLAVGFFKRRAHLTFLFFYTIIMESLLSVWKRRV